MGFIRSRFILFGRKLILKLEGRFLGEKIDCRISRPGRVQILSDPVMVIEIRFLCLYYVFRESFQGKYPLQSLNSLWLFLVFRCKISFELIVHA